MADLRAGLENSGARGDCEVAELGSMSAGCSRTSNGAALTSVVVWV